MEVAAENDRKTVDDLPALAAGGGLNGEDTR